jgi:hypothetical protein
MLAVVIGTVHPVSGGWHLERPIRVTVDGRKWTLIFKQSQFHVAVDGQEPADLSTFMNEVGSLVQGCLDALGFHLAAALRAETRSMVADGVATDGLKLAYRTPSWSDLLPELPTEPFHVPEDKLQPFVAAALDEPLARLALADLRAAIESPDDTGYLAYRAVESVRQWFLVGEQDDDNARRQSWTDMHAALALGDVDESSFAELRRLARQRRHGAIASPTESQRKEALLLARDVVARFVVHINERVTSPT